MKRNLILVLSLLVFTLIGCSPKDDEKIPEPLPTPEKQESFITIIEDIINNGLSFTYDGGEKSIDITTNEDWTITIDNNSHWCTLSITKGNAGTTSVSFKVSKNETTQKRKTTVTIQAGTVSKSFSITQNELVPEIIIDEDLIKNGIYATNPENSCSFQFTVNTNWSLNSDQEWCIPSQNSGKAGEINITLFMAANETYQNRTAKISLGTEGLWKVFYITQEQKNVISTDTDHYTKKYTAGNILIEFMCNIEFEIKIDSPWVKQSKLESQDSNNYYHKLYVDVEENPNETERTAIITIFNKEKNLKQNITITQKGQSKDDGISPDGNIGNMEWD